MELLNEIQLAFSPDSYKNNKISKQGISCENSFTKLSNNELVLDMDLTIDHLELSEKKIDLKLCFLINEESLAKEMGYCYPAREFVLSREDCDFNEAYSYRFPLSFVSALHNNEGVTFILDDQKQSRVGILKQKGCFEIIIQYKNLPVENTNRKILIKFHNGDWHQGFNAYKSWYREKYNSIEKINKNLIASYHIRRYFFNKNFCSNGIYAGAKYSFKEQYYDDKSVAGGVDLALLFDFAYTPLDDIRCGNSQPFKNLENIKELNRQIKESQEESNLLIYAYFDPYLIQDNSDFDKLYGSHLPILNKKGLRHHIWDETQWHPCLSTDQWKKESLNYLKKVSQILEVDGFYLDEVGNGQQFICNNKAHNHPVPLNQNETEYKYTNLLQKKFPDKLFMCEFFPADSNISLFSAVLSDSKTILDISRFAFPYKKIFKVIDCDRPIGDNTWDIKKIFFNGMGLWLDNDLHDSNWYSKNVIGLIKKHYRILKEYSNIFESNDVEPLVKIESEVILVNRFRKQGETIFTFLNPTEKKAICYFQLASGDSEIFDLYNNKSVEPVLHNGTPSIRIELESFAIGCIYCKGRRKEDGL